jgi:hypothetical protein
MERKETIKEGLLHFRAAPIRYKKVTANKKFHQGKMDLFFLRFDTFSELGKKYSHVVTHPTTQKLRIRSNFNKLFKALRLGKRISISNKFHH